MALRRSVGQKGSLYLHLLWLHPGCLSEPLSIELLLLLFASHDHAHDDQQICIHRHPALGAASVVLQWGGHLGLQE